jgi:hypothetical protein
VTTIRSCVYGRRPAHDDLHAALFVGERARAIDLGPPCWWGPRTEKRSSGWSCLWLVVGFVDWDAGLERLLGGEIPPYGDVAGDDE